MTVPTIFDSCRPRPDVVAGKVTEADFAADLAQVIVGKGADDYLDPARFFANTYPTRGLRNLLANVCGRLSGAGGEAASIFRLDTSYGGGKSHGLIALCHAARGGADVPGIAEFVEPALLPMGRVRIAAFDGENADPANGRRIEGGQLAFTLWGEIASALAGKDGYERVRRSDESRIAPGAETLRELFGGEPALILFDELSVYLRKVGHLETARDQLTAFLTSLFKAVESTPNAVLVYTLAIGKDGRATDAYSTENQLIADRMAEAESVSARKATLLDPTEEDETIQVLRRRLFEFIDETATDAVADAYRRQWSAHQGALPETAARPEAGEAFRASYPLHPEVLETLTAKTATLGNFQRVRGMLRLLARTVAHLYYRIREIFDGKTLDTVPFPGGPFDVADEAANGRPKLVVLGCEAVTVGAAVESVPELIERIYERKGSEGSALRVLRNNLVFVAADEARKEDMRRKACRRLALREMKKPERLVELAEHQQAQVREMEARSEQELTLAVQQCYRHLFYPCWNRVGTSDADLAHTAIDTHSASDRPGAGQQQIVRALRDLNKLRLSEDEPDSPAYVHDRTPLRKGQISTLSLRDEFRRDPACPSWWATTSSFAG